MLHGGSAAEISKIKRLAGRLPIPRSSTLPPLRTAQDSEVAGSAGFGRQPVWLEVLRHAASWRIALPVSSCFHLADLEYSAQVRVQASNQGRAHCEQWSDT